MPALSMEDFRAVGRNSGPRRVLRRMCVFYHKKALKFYFFGFVVTIGLTDFSTGGVLIRAYRGGLL